MSWVGLVVITLGPPSPPVCLVGLSATCAPWRCTRRVACVAARLPSFALVGAIAVASAAPAARTGSRVTEAVTALVSTLTGGWRAARMESASAALCSAFSLTDKAFDMSKESPTLRTPEGAVTAPNGALCEVLVRFRRGAVAAPPLGIVGSKEFLIRVCCSLACAGLVRSPVSGIPVEVSSAGAEHFGSEVVCVVVALVESRMPHATRCYDDGLSLYSLTEQRVGTNMKTCANIVSVTAIVTESSARRLTTLHHPVSDYQLKCRQPVLSTSGRKSCV